VAAAGEVLDASPARCTNVHAASLVADRAFGSAPQSVSLEVMRRLNDLTLDELRQTDQSTSKML
jgi:hypothetical protein